MCMYGKRVIKSFYDTCKDLKKSNIIVAFLMADD